MTTFLQLVISGTALGAIYALVALGITIIFQAGIISFAQGAFMVIGAYLVSYMALDLGWNFFLALFLAIIVTMLIAVVFARVVLGRVSNQNYFTVLMVTFALAIILQNIVQVIAGGDIRTNGDPWGKAGFTLFDLRFNINDLLAILVALILVGFFFLFFKYSKQGIAMRAVALDAEAASIVGINVPRVNSITWAISVGASTIAAVFLAGFPRTLDLGLGGAALGAFPAIVLGGLGSNGGAVIGGIIVGLSEVLVAGYGAEIKKIIPIGNGAQTVAPYVVLMVVLLIRPQGLFGKKAVARV